nr:hypothetical protein [Acidobacteriota bacterium]
TFHVTVDDYYSMIDVTRVITRDYGYPFEYFEIPDFIAQMNRLCTRDDVLYPLVDFFNRAHPKISAMRDKRCNNDEYRRARAAGGGRKDASLDETVTCLMKFMLAEGLIPRAVRHSAADSPGTGAAPDRAQAPWRKAT